MKYSLFYRHKNFHANHNDDWPSQKHLFFNVRNLPLPQSGNQAAQTPRPHHPLFPPLQQLPLARQLGHAKKGTKQQDLVTYLKVQYSIGNKQKLKRFIFKNRKKDTVTIICEISSPIRCPHLLRKQLWGLSFTCSVDSRQ